MAKTSMEIEQEFISDLKSRTGEYLKTLMNILKRTSIEKKHLSTLDNSPG